MEKEEIKPAKRQEGDRTEAPGQQAESHPADQRWVLALQRSAGNRAVASLLARTSPAPGAGRGVPGAPTIQRRPDGPEEEPIPKEERVWPVAWPEEAEGERNEPCFEPGAMMMLNAGIESANKAAGVLAKMPPDLKAGVEALKYASDDWANTDGANPGKAKLDEAAATLSRALVRVSAYVEPVDTMLSQLAGGASNVIEALRDAAQAMTEPEAADEEPAPCFDPGQQATIGRAVTLATEVGNELDRRPPDYLKAVRTLRSALDLASGLGGLEPGQARLKGAVSELGLMLDGVEAYLTPVADVVAEAAADAREAAAQAREAAEMAKPGPYAAGGGATAPEGGAT